MGAASLKEIDKLIREGKTASARKLLMHVMEQGVSDGERFLLASFFRRLSLPFEAIKILRPIVHPTGKKFVRATVAEQAEYASVLEKVGASAEASSILKKLDAKQYPEIHLFRAFASFAQWDYKSALIELEEFIKLPEADAHKRVVALSNYAAALVYERDPRSESILVDLVSQAQKLNYHLAEGYAYLLDVERSIYLRDWQSVEQALAKVKGFFDESELLEHLLIRKWEWIAQIYREGISSGATESLNEIRTQARKFKHWETLRSCEYHLAVVSKDQRIWDRVYFGSPFPELRSRLIKESTPMRPSAHFLYGQPKSESEKFVINLPLPVLKKTSVERGELLSNLVHLLFSDFYRPFRIAEIHAHLFRGEYFNPVTSPNKVYQVIHRLKALLKENKVPVILEEVQGMYRLRPERGYGVLIPLNLSATNQKEDWKKMLQDKFPVGKSFSLSQAVIILGINERTVQRLFSQWLSEGILTRTGKAKNTRYEFALDSNQNVKLAS